MGPLCARFDVAQLGQFISLAPSCEFSYSLGVSLAGVGIADIGGKELDEAFTHVRTGANSAGSAGTFPDRMR